MHSMLFVADVASGAKYSPLPQNLRAFTEYVSNELQQLSGGVEQLDDKVWLVNMRINRVPLGILVAGAHKNGVAFRLLPFADEPRWLSAARSVF